MINYNNKIVLIILSLVLLLNCSPLKISAEVNTNNLTIMPTGVVSLYPPDVQIHTMPINLNLVIKFSTPIKEGIKFANITIKDENTGNNYNTTAVIKADSTGALNLLVISPVVDLPFDNNFTLTIPRDAVLDEAGSGAMTNDYVVKYKTEKEFNRIAGNDRYLTGIELSKLQFGSADTVIIANGEAFPDALAAAPLAKKYNAPILLTNSQKLSVEVVNEVKRLGAKKAYIIGGTGVVPAETEKTLSDIGVSSVRLKGQDRYETAVAIAGEFGISSEVIFASGNNFPDALSIASFAAAYQIPILLIDDSKIPYSVNTFIKKSSFTDSILVGGSGVISDKTMNMLPKAVRIGGKDRYETNLKIIDYMGFDPSYAFFTTGKNFPDALSGAAIAAYSTSPIVLVDSDMNQDVLDIWRANTNIFKVKYIIGGETIVPSSLVEENFKYR